MSLHTNNIIIWLSAFTLCLLSSNSFANSRGEALYTENCAICHGESGSGGMGMPLSSNNFLDSASQLYLKKSIRLGRPGRIMPSFYWMSDRDINDLVNYIGQWRKKPARTWSQSTIKGNVTSGKALYIKHCASCHGENAQGGKGTGLRFSRPADLPITAPALNNQGLLNSMPDHMMRHIIQQPRPGSPMPSAKSLGLGTDDVNNLVSYIRQFQQSSLRKKELYSEEPASLVVESPYSFDETIENVLRAINGSNFIHIRNQELLHNFNVSNTEGSRQTIVYFCNFNFLYEALKIDPRVGMFLPCRITVTEQAGKVSMMSINPKHLSQLFNNNELDESCDKMYEVYTSILEDASL